MVNVNIIIFSILYALCNVSGAAIIKNKLLTSNIVTAKDYFIFFFDIKIIAAMIFIFISMYFSIRALALDNFSLVIPVLTGVNFLVTLFVGYLFFKDEITLTGYVGILFIIIGIYLLGINK